MAKEKMNRKLLKKISITPKFLFLILIITVIALGIAKTKSKYVSNENTINEINSNNFYFESTSLGVENKENYCGDWNGTGEYSIEFKISNYPDSLRKSECDTNYELNYQIIEPSESNATLKCYINGQETNNGE